MTVAGFPGWKAGRRRFRLKPKPRMRILLQQKESGLYFKDIGAWVPVSAEAMDFVSSTAAIEFCRRNGLSGVQVVLKFQEQHYEIVFPVQAAYGSRIGRPADPLQ